MNSIFDNLNFEQLIMAVCYSNALKIIEMQTQEKKERFQLGEISLKDYENHLCYLDDQLSNLTKGQEALLKGLGGIYGLVNSDTRR